MPLRRCDVQGCSSAAERDYGSCMICSGHKCSRHLGPEHHGCPREDDDSNRFFAAYDAAKDKHLRMFHARIDFDALAGIASILRNGMQCTLPAMRLDEQTKKRAIDPDAVAAQMGGKNCHVDIRFSDGVVWIARLRIQEPTVPPPSAQSLSLASEVSTLCFLARIGVPVPDVFYHDTDPGAVGTPFILMQKLPGKALNWPDLSAEQKTKVMRQLAEVYLTLERHPVSTAGSLSSVEGHVGPYTFTRAFTEPSQSIGPFESPEQALVGILRHERGMIETSEVSTLAADNFLAQTWRLEHVKELVAASTDRVFFIKHFDDKGDHILVDEQCNITGIIDWEFATTECKEYAFGSPPMMWPVSRYYEGSNALSQEELEFALIFEERGRLDMAQCVRQGRKHQRFLDFLGGAVSPERGEFEALFQGLRETFDGRGIEPYGVWKGKAVEAMQQAPALQRLLREEAG